jgi:1-phosphatidylinositol-3-phosphate 5-kinase
MGRENPCRKKNGCTFTLGQHEIRIIHEGIKITVKVTDGTKNIGEGERKAQLGDEIDVWERCAVCNAKTSRKRMSRGSW